ncbi:MAG: exodeoxyribonuclease V subunit gamma, partial [Oscillospiraceae bacterium]|nr:exodeoxyribonuclease V subunit gamma [Oscillospiraceae bacterium]
LSDYTLDKGGKLLMMQRALQEIAGKLKIYGRSSRKVTFLEDLVSLTDEFHSYAVSPEALSREADAAEGAAGEKLREIALIYGTYEGKLCSTVSDRRDRLTKLAENLPASHYVDGKDVYIDGFSYFNGLEEDIIAVLLRRARSVTVTLLGDKYAKSDDFTAAIRARDRLLRLAQVAGVESRILFVRSEGNTPFDHIEREFFRGQMPYEGEAAEKIRVLRAVNTYSEVEMAAGEIRRLVQSGAYRYRDIAVAARNMPDYESAVESIFQRYDIPVFCNERSDILEKPMLRVLLGALDAINSRFEYEDMFTYLKTGLAGVTPDECDELENYALKWDIRGNLWLRDAPWTAHPQGYSENWDEADIACLARLNTLRDMVRMPLNHLYNALNTSDRASDKVKALYSFALEIRLPEQVRTKAQMLLEAGNSKLAEEYRQLWDIFCGVLDQFHEILQGSELSNEDFARLFRLVLTQYDVGTIPVSLDQVAVGDVGRNDRHGMKVLFLLGANDNVLPNTENGGGLLNAEERELLTRQGIRLAPTGLDQFHVELQDIHQILSRPEERLYISYPAADISGSELRPSFVVERILKLFEDVKIENEPNDRSYRLTAVVPALEECAAPRCSGLREQLMETEAYARVLEKMEKASRVERGSLSPDVVRSLYGSRFRMSASRMDAVRQCHFAYFMQYGLKAKERRVAGLDAPEIGTFVHFLLENVFREIAETGDFANVAEEAVEEMVQRYVDSYAKSRLGDPAEHTARFRYLFKRLCNTAVSIVKNAVAEMKDSDFRPVAFELDFSAGGDMPAITIEEPGATLTLGGKVDRVDGWLKDGKLYLRVVDYKTGKKAFDLNDVRYGLNVQMLLYLEMLRQNGKDYFGQEIEPAGILYFPAREEILSMPRGISPEKLQAEMDKHLRRSGLLLDQSDVLRAMEHDALTEPRYLPLKVKKDGSLSGDIASAAQLGKLGRYVEELLQQITCEIRDGRIDADPCKRGPNDTACTYCPFASACQFEEGRDKFRYMEKLRGDAFWAAIDKNGKGADGNG